MERKKACSLVERNQINVYMDGSLNGESILQKPLQVLKEVMIKANALSINLLVIDFNG